VVPGEHLAGPSVGDDGPVLAVVGQALLDGFEIAAAGIAGVRRSEASGVMAVTPECVWVVIWLPCLWSYLP